ncbi:helix-turn-helix domain-containing protein [Streptomyces antarcticus]|uniref:helix-turn-helix domain-containing protein n=1 Tax=Streptomyces antarcticus TaxID=2996458 RepID=UPI00226E19F7|nr:MULTISPECIES: helix-turn-helix transcriptional regulator [unclassified Streptomyces]MCY0944973.1 helix-turn-helix transcriptional regulator [Streptomyces sp. H34-AA3]MCY0951499.1 helix-turn-helix transcriptional regulator [Streptomyces sp. H27-S2]MCZ4082145.1 helix-turn-helix transcriptional regulator [Streptomyces sp. H34-S5]
MNGKVRLGDFLRTRRSQLLPEEIGVPTYGERRRVPGLRREELALLAGVSVSYYTRLEQGQSLNASPQVLDAVARALRLEETERLHLHDLARSAAGPVRGRRPAPERVAQATGQLLEVLDHVPAIVTGRRSDVLAWNPLGHALFAGHLDPDAADRSAERPNMARLVFLDAHTRDLYADWPAKARAVVGNLRLVAGQYPDDTALHALVGELSSKSPDFASMWADHRVKACAVATYEMRHPLVGPLTVTQQTLSQGQGPGPGQNIVVATTAADSPARTALALLAQIGRPGDPARPGTLADTGRPATTG